MPSLNTTDESLNDDNAHVQELKRIFLSCNVDERECLTAIGLSRLCDKLKLTAFAPDIITRVLHGEDHVNFHDFKDRFVALLPEIIDVSSGTVDELVTKTVQNARKLGIGDASCRLTRYETRLLCENTSELQSLTSGDVSALFDRADIDRNGRVSVHQFLQQYRLQKRLSAEVHFIADSFVSTLNLFDALDTANTGTIDSHDLLEYWSKAGLRIDEGISVLKQCGQPIAGTVNAVFLSGFLERELSDAAAEAPVAVKTAIIALHSCIDYLRCCVKENETQTEYLQKQLQLANQRRTMLIEELEQNQLSIEQAFESRLHETEERFKMKLGQFEEKSRQEKRDLQNDIDKLDDDLSRSKQSEASMRNKMTMLERQCGRLNEEAREFTETISQLEQLNRQLRTELSKAMQPRPQDDNANVLMWKQKTELLVAHNKRLREKVQELSLNQKKNKAVRDVNPLFTKWSSAFKSQVMMFRKRRLARGDTLSEMDSEPEAIFARVRRRRLRKRKERKQRHERLLARLSIQQDDASSSTSTEGKIPKSHSSSTVHKNSIKQLEERVGKLQDDHRRELAQIKLTASKTLAEALNDQEKQLNSQYERQLELRISGERSQLEQSFANEKMKLMTRLQEDFESELQRISASTQSEGPAAIEQYKRQIKMLESSLEGQRNGYEKRLAEMRDKYRNQVRAHTSSVLIDKNTNNFLALIEKYKNLDPSTSIFEQVSPRLGVEKRHHHMPFQRSMSSMSSRCERCELVDARLRELYHTCTGDTTTAESGIEDIGSSAGSLSDDKIVLKREIRKLKGRLEAAKEKVAELRVLFSMQNGSSSARYKCAMGGSQDSQQTAEWRRTPITKWSDVNPTIERLESEKLILESRLSEAQLLIKNLVEQYRKQLDETARLGAILQEMYAQQSPNENGSIAKSAPPTSRPSS